MAKKGNMFDTAVQAREQEQSKITAAVIGGVAVKEEKTKITLSITKEDSKKIKKYAVDNETTVSDLLHDWIEEKCGE